MVVKKVFFQRIKSKIDLLHKLQLFNGTNVKLDFKPTESGYCWSNMIQIKIITAKLWHHEHNRLHSFIIQVTSPNCVSPPIIKIEFFVLMLLFVFFYTI